VEVAFVNDKGKVMVADDPTEPNIVREYVPREPIERALVLTKELHSRTQYTVAGKIVELLNEALGD
jgi:hypothetical protein